MKRRPARLPTRTLRCSLVASLALLSPCGEPARTNVSPAAAHFTPEFEGPVPDPFEPVRVHRGASTVEVEVWGRRYALGEGGMPQRIESQGVALLDRPVRWELETSHGAQPSWSAPELVTSTPTAASFVSTARLGDLLATSRTQVEFDGMIRVDLLLRASTETQLKRVAYEWTLPETVAHFFQHHLEYDYEKLRADKRKLLASAGIVSAGTRRFPYVSTFLLANRSVGIEWWSESNQGWAPHRDGPMRVQREGGVVRLLIEAVARSIRLPANGTWQHTFAVFPMPMRPEPAQWRAVRFTSPQVARRVGAEAGARYYWIPFPGHFEARWHGLPESVPNRKQRELREQLRGQGIGYIPYGKLAATPSLHPTPQAKAAEWAATGRPFTGPGAGQQHFLEAKGWKTGQAYGYAACLARWDYLDWMLRENLEILEAESLDGLYFDIGDVWEPCQRALAPDDPKEVQLWNHFNVRAFYRQLYAEVQKRRPGALITIHTHGAPRALSAFVDYAFTGEALNVVFGGGRSFAAMKGKPELYDGDYFDLPEGFLEAMMRPRIGGITSLLPQVVRVRAAERSDPTQHKLTRAFLAQTLVGDLHFWLTKLNADEMISVLRARDRFGDLDAARLHPWWSEPIARADPRLRVTGYARDGRLLLVVANWEDVAITSTVDVDTKRTGWKAIGRVQDAERKQALPASSGRFDVTVPPRDFRLILVEAR